MKKLLLKIEDDVLYEAIKQIAKDNKNDVTRTINEMLWLALKPKIEQTKKVLALRANTIRQLNIKTTTKEEQEYTDEDYDKFLDQL